MDDEEFAVLNQLFLDDIHDYIKDNVIDEFIAFYIAAGYKKGFIQNENLQGVINGAIDTLCEVEYGTKKDIKKLKKILKEKYNLSLTNCTKIELKEIRKKD